MEKPILYTDRDIAGIYGKHVDTVYRIALTMLNSVPEAEDATQTAFVRLMAAEKVFENDEHIKAWLIVTTKNICKDSFKSWWHAKRADLESAPRPEAATEIFDSEIWQAISDLDEKHKLLVLLHYHEGYTTAEIAKMLGVNHATVRTRLRAAKAKLKLMLNPA